MIEADILKLYLQNSLKCYEYLQSIFSYLECILYLKIKQVKVEKFYSHFTTDIEKKNETNTYVKSMD